jgi:hypothetical protein
MHEIIQADILDWAKNYTGGKFHSMLCDPPYHLTTITKRFGQPGSVPAKGDVYRRASKGFMGTTWDGLDESGQGIAFRPETWAALAEHLYPGAFVMAFAASRGWHRMAVALEDAGLIIHPSIFMLGWAYGSGFPKATRIDTQVDREAGVEREAVRYNGTPAGFIRHGRTDEEVFLGTDSKKSSTITAPATPLAQTWSGHRYGLQAMKPALEPIILAQKPYSGRPVDNITATGAGALNIDGGRIETEEGLKRISNGGNLGEQWRMGVRPGEWGSDSGRWPANLILQHTSHCSRAGNDWQCVDGCPVKMLGEQSGESISKRAPRGGTSPNPRSWGDDRIDGDMPAGISDSGTAARFFYKADWAYEVYEQLVGADPIFYTAKPGNRERNAGLEALPMRTRNRVNSGGLENEPRWAPTQAKNIHPTVKPISLTKYLATLLLPPAAYAPRRILCPFSGSGSEMIGALLAGWDEVIGIEQSPEYWQISQARLAWWADWLTWGQTDVDAILAAAGEEAKETAAKQLGLF